MLKCLSIHPYCIYSRPWYEYIIHTLHNRRPVRSTEYQCDIDAIEHRLLLIVNIIRHLVWYATLSTFSSVEFLLYRKKQSVHQLFTIEFVRARNVNLPVSRYSSITSFTAAHAPCILSRADSMANSLLAVSLTLVITAALLCSSCSITLFVARVAPPIRHILLHARV